MNSYKHLIISRVALKWYDDAGEKLRCENELNMSWEDWLVNSISLYTTYTRKSLAAQTNQNFILLSVIDDSVNDIGELLPNEMIIKIDGIKSFKKTVISFIEENLKSDIYLMSRIDRDDCFERNYVKNLQLLVNQYLTTCTEPAEYWFDTKYIHSYGIDNNILAIREYAPTVTSPFTSVLTKSASPDLYSGHGRICERMNGLKSDKLTALQIIHTNNLLNKINGERINPNIVNKKLLDFGIKKNPSFAIDDNLYNWILKNIPKGSTILELGSGYGTIDLAKHYKMISIESDPSWINLANSKYIYAPLVNGWYDVDILKLHLPELKYDVILVDGPWVKDGNRIGFINNLDLFNKDVIVIFDDTHRKAELSMCVAFANSINKPYQEFIGPTKNFSIIKNN